MKSLVIVAHGSRRASSNQELAEISSELAGLLNDEYPIMEVGFLELAQPLIPASLEKVIKQGATEIDVFPYFLSAGNHVVRDVPEEINVIQDKYPDIPINILPYLGALPNLKQFMAKSICGLILDNKPLEGNAI